MVNRSPNAKLSPTEAALLDEGSFGDFVRAKRLSAARQCLAMILMTTLFGQGACHPIWQTRKRSRR
ncbi:MAG: hypothetical protein EBV34_13655 [Betaproteobacteria bacterium]|nr:hypothetical protein [Betaproteobacteria bacterium]